MWFWEKCLFVFRVTLCCQNSSRTTNIFNWFYYQQGMQLYSITLKYNLYTNRRWFLTFFWYLLSFHFKQDINDKLVIRPHKELNNPWDLNVEWLRLLSYMIIFILGMGWYSYRKSDIWSFVLYQVSDAFLFQKTVTTHFYFKQQYLGQDTVFWNKNV